MNNTISAFPLQWPPNFSRAKSREKGAFKTTLAAALNNVQTSLQRFAKDSKKKIEGIVMSSNVTLGAQRPEDPGVAVWFTWDAMILCIAVDRYSTVEANLQAIHHIIEARRVELRHGTLSLVRATFAGFLALPAPTGREWWQVLNVKQTATPEEIKTAYRKLAGDNHPDRGDNETAMAEINAAYQKALA